MRLHVEQLHGKNGRCIQRVVAGAQGREHGPVAIAKHDFGGIEVDLVVIQNGISIVRGRAIVADIEGERRGGATGEGGHEAEGRLGAAEAGRVSGQRHDAGGHRPEGSEIGEGDDDFVGEAEPSLV